MTTGAPLPNRYAWIAVPSADVTRTDSESPKASMTPDSVPLPGSFPEFPGILPSDGIGQLDMPNHRVSRRIASRPARLAPTVDCEGP
ncbi:hypothetical protein JS278_02897 [Acidipropionibacterium virtanenii]|uniref:Uncharacterized protein n=1 Tax=Acidipropionibacterium virtanenii TaxID=2057246 RepID=A0A344UXN3_9ACTN|nr:hypothetical protein JS278_02897 [Acidipropionibacterium virtanenii]